jgi:hypothetical protein
MVESGMGVVSALRQDQYCQDVWALGPLWVKGRPFWTTVPQRCGEAPNL